MPGTIALSTKNIQPAKWDDDHQPKASTVSGYVLPHQIDTMSSAINGDSPLPVSKSPSCKVAASGNQYYQDTLSSYTADPMNQLITLASRSSLPKQSATKESATVVAPTVAAAADIDFDEAQALVKTHYQEALAKAGEQTQEIIKQSKAQSAGAKSTLEQRLEQLSQAIDDELKKDHINFDALQALVLKAVMLHMRKTARVEHEYTSELGVQIKVKALEVKKASASKTQLGITLVSSAFGLGGAVGLAPLVTNSISQATATAVAAASQSASHSASGVTNLVVTRDSSDKWHKEVEFRLMQTKEDNAKERQRGNSEVIKVTKSLVEELFRNKHQLFTSFSSNGG